MKGGTQQEGIDLLYSGELGEVRHSTFYRLDKEFSGKTGFSIKYVLSGQENYELEKESFSLNEGQVLFFKDENYYRGCINSPTAVSGLCVDLNFEHLSKNITDPLNEQGLFFFGDDFKTQRIAFLEKRMHYIMNNVVQKNIEKNHMLLEEFINDLMLVVLKIDKNYAEKINKVPSKKSSYQKELFRRLLESKNYIHDFQNQEITLKDIAQSCHISTFYFQRIFTKVFGYSPSTYLEQLRMKKAEKLLLKNKRVKEVCFSIGYSDESYFCRRFKKYHGLTPKQYQLEKRKLIFQ